MEIRPTPLHGVFVIEPKRHGDARGYFSETWNRAALERHGIDLDFVQDNHSLSAEPGTLRGLHYQAPPHAQDKLVRCTRGTIFDVAVDIRKGSPTYGKHYGLDLSAENGLQLLVPKGFLHGFLTRTPDCEVVYKVTDYYSAECDGSVQWDSCGIDWNLNGAVTLSAKDQTAVPFEQFDSPFALEAA